MTNGDAPVTHRDFEARCIERREALEALFEERLDGVEGRLAHLQELFDHRLASAERALSLQAAEYERRLSELNNAHERAIHEAARTLPKERFEIFERDYTAFRRQTETNHAAAVGAANAAQAIARGWAMGIGLVVSLISFALRFWK